VTVTDPAAPAVRTRMLWLDLTRKCQLECAHCYNSSGPDGGHGDMTRADWLGVVGQAAEAGTELVQLIGGEPTLHPDALDIIEHALHLRLSVEVYSNLVRISNAWWNLFQRDGVSVATSYYSHDPARHGQMTGRPASHRHTRTNIVTAVELGVPLRVGIITTDGLGVGKTRSDLESLGVTRIGVDHVRPFGRGSEGSAPDVSGLCGACGDGRASIGPDGAVSPCVFSGWMSVGSIHDGTLVDILSGLGMAKARERIAAGKKDDPPPNPIPCGPDTDICKPGGPPSNCRPRT
jgi:hypothetical protein